jgi:hypothetical protein
MIQLLRKFSRSDVAANDGSKSWEWERSYKELQRVRVREREREREELQTQNAASTKELEKANAAPQVEVQILTAQLVETNAQLNAQVAMQQLQTRELESELRKLKAKLAATEAAASSQHEAHASPSDAASSMQQPHVPPCVAALLQMDDLSVESSSESFAKSQVCASLSLSLSLSLAFSFSRARALSLCIAYFDLFVVSQAEIRLFVRSIPVARAISALFPCGSDTDPLSGIRGMSDGQVDLCMTKAANILGSLFKEQIRTFQNHPITKQQADKANKFCFSIEGGNMDDFKSGVSGRVGEPHQKLEEGMEREHTRESDSDTLFRSLNYGILTTPREEYKIVVSGGKDLGVNTASHTIARVLRTLAYYGTFSHDGKLLHSNLPLIQKANLTRGEIIAIILYTGPCYQIYNSIIRRCGHCGVIDHGVPPVPVMERCEKAGHRYSSTIHLIVSGVEKIRLAQDIKDGMWLYRGLSGGELPPQFWTTGFTEFAFMSMTQKLEVAIDYSGVKQGSIATVLATQTSQVDRGAFISEFSQFPGEEETLWNPLSYIQRQPGMGRDELRDSPQGLVRIIYVKINSNGRAMTTDELQGRRKNVIVAMSETLGKEVVRDIFNIKESQVFQKRIEQDSKNWEIFGQDFLSSITSGIDRRVKSLQSRSAESYLDDNCFRDAVTASMKLPTLARNKLQYYLDNGSFACEEGLISLSLDIVSRRMLGVRRRSLEAARGKGH